jgi:Na+/proline symporter
LKKDDYQLYISGAIKLGVSFGVVSLLSRWVTGNTILSSPETLVKYGLIGGIGYSLVGALSAILFGFFAKKVQDHHPNQQTIGDVMKQKLTPSGYWFMIILLLLTSFHSLFIQAMGAGILIHMIFPIPHFIGILLFLIFCFFIGGVGGMQRLHKVAGVNVSLIFAAVIIIPVYFFIQEGVYPVYDGIKLYHPYLLYIKNSDAIWFIFTAIFVFFGQILIDRATWQRIFILKKEKVRITFTLTGLIWATIPLALTSLLMITIFGGGFEDIYTLFFELVNKIQSTVLIALFVVFCISSIASALSAELHATTSLFVKNVMNMLFVLTNGEKWKYTYIFSGAICLCLLVIVSILTPKTLTLLFFTGNIYAAVICPILYIILSKSVLPFIVPFSSFIGAAGGFVLLMITPDFKAIWLSFAISAFICFIVFVYKIVTRKNTTDLLGKSLK